MIGTIGTIRQNALLANGFSSADGSADGNSNRHYRHWQKCNSTDSSADAVPMQCRCSADHKCPSALLKALLTNGFEGKVPIVPILLGLQMLQLGRRL
jgi:hypothetical protein